MEDDHAIAETLSELLSEEGYVVTVATNGKEALALLSIGLRPALMVVDMLMPVMGGMEFLRACNANPDLARTPAILMSAARPLDPAVSELQSYLQKPFQAEELVEQIARLLS